VAGSCEYGGGTVLIGNCAVRLVGLRPTHTISCKPWKRSGSAVNTTHGEKLKITKFNNRKDELTEYE